MPTTTPSRSQTNRGSADKRGASATRQVTSGTPRQGARRTPNFHRTSRKAARRAGTARRTVPSSGQRQQIVRLRNPGHTASLTTRSSVASEDAWGITPEHLLAFFCFVVGAALSAVFALDLLTGVPFWRASAMYDVTNVAAGLALVYLSWNVYRDL